MGNSRIILESATGVGEGGRSRGEDSRRILEYQAGEWSEEGVIREEFSNPRLGRGLKSW